MCSCKRARTNTEVTASAINTLKCAIMASMRTEELCAINENSISSNAQLICIHGNSFESRAQLEENLFRRLVQLQSYFSTKLIEMILMKYACVQCIVLNTAFRSNFHISFENVDNHQLELCCFWFLFLFFFILSLTKMPEKQKQKQIKFEQSLNIVHSSKQK